jgi:hypothetical protein
VLGTAGLQDMLPDVLQIPDIDQLLYNMFQPSAHARDTTIECSGISAPAHNSQTLRQM